MLREEAHALMSALVCGTHKECSSNHYRDVALGIDKIYDAFENRNCRNCNHCSDDCDEDGEWYCEERFKNIELDFYCSKYELKQ